MTLAAVARAPTPVMTTARKLVSVTAMVCLPQETLAVFQLEQLPVTDS
jgi:hypothetical protein